MKTCNITVIGSTATSIQGIVLNCFQVFNPALLNGSIQVAIQIQNNEYETDVLVRVHSVTMSVILLDPGSNSINGLCNLFPSIH